MLLKNTLTEPYRIYMDLIIGIPIAMMVFGFPLIAYELGQWMGPKVGETVFEFTHPNQLGSVTYTHKE